MGRRCIAIAAADLHLRNDQPPCRTDNFVETQKRKLAELVDASNVHAVPVIVAGDLFHKPIANSALLEWVISILDKLDQPMLCVAGQHDLPNHNLARYKESGMAVLEAAGLIIPLTSKPYLGVVGSAFGEEPPACPGASILVRHEMVWQKLPFPGAPATGNATAFIKRMPAGYRFILTGDNHRPFTVPGKTTTLINCGPMTRQNASEADVVPIYWILYDDGKAVPQSYPAAQDAVSLEHLGRKKELEERFNTFVEHLEQAREVGLSFEHNLECHLKANAVAKPVCALVREWSGIS